MILFIDAIVEKKETFNILPNKLVTSAVPTALTTQR